jgi:hypothetical protein
VYSLVMSSIIIPDTNPPKDLSGEAPSGNDGAPEDPKESAPPILMMMHSSSKTLRLLNLVQMYNDVHTKFLQESFATMLWNLTKSRRALQARAHPSNVVHCPVLQASLIPPDRSFAAQRRLYRSENDIATTTDERTAAWSLQDSDDHGGRRKEIPPELREEETLRTEHSTTGLRQRNVGAVRASAPPDRRGGGTEALSTQEDPVPLLIRSSHGLFSHESIPASLPPAQEDAMRCLQYACRLGEIQAAMATLMTTASSSDDE